MNRAGNSSRIYKRDHFVESVGGAGGQISCLVSLRLIQSFLHQFVVEGLSSEGKPEQVRFASS
jgi:hypothetical protein